MMEPVYSHDKRAATSEKVSTEWNYLKVKYFHSVSIIVSLAASISVKMTVRIETESALFSTRNLHFLKSALFSEICTFFEM